MRKCCGDGFFERVWEEKRVKTASEIIYEVECKIAILKEAHPRDKLLADAKIDTLHELLDFILTPYDTNKVLTSNDVKSECETGGRHRQGIDEHTGGFFCIDCGEQL